MVLLVIIKSKQIILKMLLPLAPVVRLAIFYHGSPFNCQSCLHKKIQNCSTFPSGRKIMSLQKENKGNLSLKMETKFFKAASLNYKQLQRPYILLCGIFWWDFKSLLILWVENTHYLVDTISEEKLKKTRIPKFCKQLKQM